MGWFSIGQQRIVLLIIFALSFHYFISINIPDISSPRTLASAPMNNNEMPKMLQGPPDKEKLSGACLLTLNKPIDINTASLEDFTAIPGIGPKTAERIIEYRNRKGRFKKIEEIMNVEGIKGKRFEKIKRYLTVTLSTTH